MTGRVDAVTLDVVGGRRPGHAGPPVGPRRPRLPPDLVDRPRLLARLERAVGGTLTLVRAPAGYGKTTLLGSWLATGARPAAWLTLEARDDAPEAFVRALVGAVRAVVPEAGKDALALLNLPEPPASPRLAAALADELGAQAGPPGGPLVVVLDDYEQVRAEAVHALLAAFLFRLPAWLHVVVASRALPPLPLPSLRAAGQLAELGVEDLRFGAAEARALLERALGERLPERTVGLVAERTEGWPAGLRLAAVLLRERPDRAAVLAALGGGSHAYIRDYLLEEVLARQAPEARRFLLATAILDRFCGPLCDAVVGVPAGAGGTGAELLGRLERDGVMLVGLDERGEWYRYHHLFEELLRRRLAEEAAPGQVAGLHRRAAGWLAGAGAVVEAARHLVAAGDDEAAARLVEGAVHPALNREDWAGLAGALEALPPEPREARPGLLLGRAWVLHFRGRVAAMAPLLEQAESALAARPPAAAADGAADAAADPDAEAAVRLRGELDTLWGEVWLQRDDPRAALARAQRGGEHLAEEQLYARGVADGLLGVALQRRGRGRDALGMYRARAARETGATAVYTARLLLIMGYCHLAEGRLDLLEGEAWRILALARERRLPVTEAWVRHLLGRVLYEWDEPARAAEQHAAVVGRRDEAHYEAYRDSAFGLALAHQALRQPGRAREEVARLLRLLREAGRPGQLAVVRAFEARLALLRGDAETWGRWLDANREALAAEPSGAAGGSEAFAGLEVPALTRARALIAVGDAASVGQAQDELAALRGRYAAAHDRARLVEVSALQALACQAREDRGSALAALERALAAGRRGGYVRTFVDLGPPMAGLLAALATRRPGGRPSGYLGRLLAACARAGAAADPAARPAGAADDPAADPRAAGPIDRGEPVELVEPVEPIEPIEPLTWREQDVLRHLARRLSNKEIAGALAISPLTVKKHAESIYRKLHVSGRRDAARRAQALGLL
jgi:LuxR family maltose regulon positive regulatory protein